MVSVGVTATEKAKQFYIAVIKTVREYENTNNLCFKSVDGFFCIAFDREGHAHSICVGYIDARFVVEEIARLHGEAMFLKKIGAQRIHE